MNKFVFAADGLRLSEAAMDYSIYFARNYSVHVVAAFLREMGYKSQPVGQDIWWPYYPEYAMKTVEEVNKKDTATRNAAVKKLQKKFDDAGVPFNIHKDNLIAIQALLQESYFADAVLAASDTTFSNYETRKPGHFIRALLSDAGCPVILTPSSFSPIERFVFAYDGTPASAYAIRQFTYLFPLLPGQEVEIVFATDKADTTHVPHQNMLSELLKRKYKTMLKSVLRRKDPEEALALHMETENRNCMLVMGAYHRSALSMWMHQSVADRMIRDLDIPVFIAHS